MSTLIFRGFAFQLLDALPQGGDLVFEELHLALERLLFLFP
jgi:hypothetical protein